MKSATNETEHTPTPWHVSPASSDDNEPIHLVWDATGSQMVANTFYDWGGRIQDIETRKANAAFIVRACNAHDALVESASRVLAMHDDAMFICGCDDTGIVNKNLKSLRAALALAKGE